MLNNLPVVTVSEVQLPVSQLSIETGLSESRIRNLIKKYSTSTAIIQSAMELRLELEHGSKLNKTLDLLVAHDGNVDIVRDIYAIRSELEEVSLKNISLLLTRFQGSDASQVITEIQRAHEISRKKFVGSTVSALLVLADSLPGICWIEHLVDAYDEQINGGLCEEDSDDEEE